MRWPPYLMKLGVCNPRHSFAIWLPLFIIGTVVLVVVLAALLVALPFMFLSFLFTWRADIWLGLRKVPALWDIVLSLRGLKVDIENGEDRITVILY
jgi:hypothetical protein